MIEEENDPALAAEGEEAVEGVEKSIDELQLMTMLNGEYDHNNAIPDLPRRHRQVPRPRTGPKCSTVCTPAGPKPMGTALRCWTCWTATGRYQVRLHDGQGRERLRYAQSEHGVHRLVRISPFDANARRQTSSPAWRSRPELDNNINIEINPPISGDAGLPFLRRGRPAHQQDVLGRAPDPQAHRHCDFSCRLQRSQLQNREYAMEMMKAKLYQIALQQHKDKIDDIKGVQNEIAWGHQIRSYVFMPYTLVKDNRTGYEQQRTGRHGRRPGRLHLCGT